MPEIVYIAKNIKYKKIIDYSHSGLIPQYMRLDPIYIIEKLLLKIGASFVDFDLIKKSISL